jgi:hypothetical protein
VENSLAQIELWRSILSLSYVQGDLKPFLQLVSIAESNRGLPIGGAESGVPPISILPESK